MIRFNRSTITKSGEKVIPFLVEGETVYCFDSANNTIIKEVSDFEGSAPVTTTKEKNTVVVTPIIAPTDQLFDENEELVPVIPVESIEPEVKPIIEEPTPQDPLGGIDDEDYI